MTVYSLLALLFWLLFTASSVIMLRGWKKTALFRPGSVIWGQAAAFASQFLYGIMAGNPADFSQWVLLLIPGLTGGVIWGKFARVRQTARGIALNYARPGAAAWAALMAITQLATIFTGAAPGWLFGLSVLTLGANLGLNGKVLLSHRRLVRQAAGMMGA